ncbi:putative fungal pheromone GPCR, STE3-type [Mycena polygramma]|nr:putative fungal pheromone GPCR, STE3-type [Mycena polygramma]
MIWTALACFNNFINAVVWHNNITDWAPVWCDISTRITVGVSVAIPAASLCTNRRLYKIAACQTVSITKAQKRRIVMVDCAIGVGIPVLQMILQYVVHGHRYNTMEDVGYYPTTYNTPWRTRSPTSGRISSASSPPAIVVRRFSPHPPPVFTIPLVVLSLSEFNRRRAQFALLLSGSASSSSPLSLSRYFRLMSLATIELVFNTPISAYGLYLTITHDRIRPWVSWANTHFDFGTIDVFPGIVWRASTSTVVTIELSRWAVVFCAFVFFAFFGFAAEARKHYRMAFWAVGKRMGFTPPKDNAFPSIRLPWSKDKPKPAVPFSLAASSSMGGKSLPRTPVKQRPDSLSPSLADSRTDYDFDDITDAETDAHSMEKREYILPSPSSSSSARGFAPPYVRDVEEGAYPPSPTVDAESPSPRTPRPMTWPSLHSPRPPPPTFPPAHAPAS